MNRYDENYSAYFKASSKEYPEGSAVDSSSEDNLDGTPYLAAFFDDVIGFMYAAFHGVFGNPKIPGETVERELSNKPDNATESDVWDAIKTFVQRKADAVSGALTSAINGVKQSLDEFIATKGKANGFASLDASGQVPASQLPSYVDDVLEYASRSAFPASGEKGKIYVALDTNKSYRWSGTTYIELSKYNDATQSASGLMSASDKTKLDGIESGAQVNTVTSVSGRTGAVTNNQIREDMATMGAATATAAGTKGLVPPPAANMMGAFLMGNGTWGFPPDATVDSALNPDSTNSVQNKIVTANVNGVLCSTSPSIQEKAVSGPAGFVLYEGAVVRVLFQTANTAENPQLNINGTGARPIVSYRHGSAVALDKWDAGTTMELIYDELHWNWVVMGNPVVMSDFESTKGYIKYANGLLIQWGHLTGTDNKVSFPIAYTNMVIPVGDWASPNTPGEAGDHMKTFSLTGFEYVYGAYSPEGTSIPWIAIGY